MTEADGGASRTSAFCYIFLHNTASASWLVAGKAERPAVVCPHLPLPHCHVNAILRRRRTKRPVPPPVAAAQLPKLASGPPGPIRNEAGRWPTGAPLPPARPPCTRRGPTGVSLLCRRSLVPLQAHENVRRTRPPLVRGRERPRVRGGGGPCGRSALNRRAAGRAVLPQLADELRER